MLSFLAKLSLTLLHAAGLVLLGGIVLLAEGLGWRITAAVLFVYLLYMFIIKLLRVAFCLHARAAFCRRLRKWAKARSLTYRQHHSPLAPFFKSYIGADITMGEGEGAIHLKFFPYVTHRKVVHVVNRRQMVFSETWGMPFLKTSYDKSGNSRTDQLFQRVEKAQLYFEEQQKNGIWLIPPKTDRLTVNRTVGVVTVHNGYQYKNSEHFYEYTACLQALDKNNR